MATKEFFTDSEELKKLMSAARATITAPFFGNNVEEVKTVSEAYKLAKNSPGTIELTGMPVYKPEKVGLPQGANQLLFNDGTVVGRCAAARKIVGEPNCDLKYLLPIIREAIYQTRDKLMYKTEVSGDNQAQRGSAGRGACHIPESLSQSGSRGERQQGTV